MKIIRFAIYKAMAWLGSAWLERTVASHIPVRDCLSWKIANQTHWFSCGECFVCLLSATIRMQILCALHIKWGEFMLWLAIAGAHGALMRGNCNMNRKPERITSKGVWRLDSPHNRRLHARPLFISFFLIFSFAFTATLLCSIVCVRIECIFDRLKVHFLHEQMRNYGRIPASRHYCHIWFFFKSFNSHAMSLSCKGSQHFAWSLRDIGSWSQLRGPQLHSAELAGTLRALWKYVQPISNEICLRICSF